MKVLDYRVLEGDDIEQRVWELVEEGYEPLGGVAIRHGSSYGATYVQAMVKFEKLASLPCSSEVE